MSVVEKADHIVVLGDGTVKEEGSHTELMAKGSFYTELVRTENKSFHRQEEQEWWERAREPVARLSLSTPEYQ